MKDFFSKNERNLGLYYSKEENDNYEYTNAASLAKTLCLNDLHVVLPEFYRAVSILA